MPHNKEALPCGCRGTNCQPLHVQYSSDGSRSLTTLTTPCREHHGGGRRQGLGRGRRGAGPREAGAGGSTAGHGRQEQATRPALLWAAGARRPEVEEALWPLDAHHTVTGVLIKLTKPSVPVNLVGPQVSPTIWWVLASRGVFIFLGVIRRHFLACEDIAGGSDLSAGGTFFS